MCKVQVISMHQRIYGYKVWEKEITIVLIKLVELIMAAVFLDSKAVFNKRIPKERRIVPLRFVLRLKQICVVRMISYI